MMAKNDRQAFSGEGAMRWSFSIAGRRGLRMVRSASTGMCVPEIENDQRIAPKFRAHPRGFTLLEILIALFIFAILALLLSSALHNVIGVQSRTEVNAERLHDTQIAMLMMSRDVTQAISRPVFVASGKEEPAFVGKPNGFSFTHAGMSNADGKMLRSTLQRARYFIEGTTLWRYTWAALDQAPQSAPMRRALLTNIDHANFEYLDSKHAFHPEWPVSGGPREVLPRAVKVTLVMNKWGKLTQLYVIAAEPSNVPNAQPQKSKQETESAQ